ncbi:MAG: NUDIX hydrolase [Cyanobacteriota bacterium]|nr:NUDIX hydrolase [Cyanobacteriota bacterium]
MSPSLSATHQPLAIEAELPAGPYRFVRERLRLPMGLEGSFGWLRHPPSVMVVPQLRDGRVLVLRRYRPAVGWWVWEFPSGTLEPEESPAAGGERLLRELTGHGGQGWRPLGQLRPNPGYSDELMTLGQLIVEDGVDRPGADWGAGEGDTPHCRLLTPQAVEAALSALEEPVDGRSVSAWWLAQRRGNR